MKALTPSLWFRIACAFYLAVWLIWKFASGSPFSQFEAGFAQSLMTLMIIASALRDTHAAMVADSISKFGRVRK